MIRPGIRSPRDTSYDLLLTNAEAGLVTPLTLARGGEDNLPIWSDETAPTTTPLVNTSGDPSSQDIPPEQGIDIKFENVSGGAGSYFAVNGRYAFGRHINTAEGYVEPGPPTVRVALQGGGALAGPIKAWCKHHDYTYIGAGNKVYYFDYLASPKVLKETLTQPTVGGGGVITDMISHAGLLMLVFDNASDWAASEDDGDTWKYAIANYGVSSAVARGKHLSIREARSEEPVLVMVRDPDKTYTTTDITDPALWDTGNRVGDRDSANSDHFTSCFVDPSTGETLFGKELGLRRADAQGNVDLIYGPTKADAGVGLESFAWPSRVGSDLYFQVHEYELRRYSQGTIDPKDYGPTALAPGVTEMQKAIVATAGGVGDWLYVALSGTDGDVMRFRMVQNTPQYHGSYVSIGEAITNRMWLTSDPLADDKSMYLWITPSATPYTPYRALIPAGSPDADPSSTYNTTAEIRFGLSEAGKRSVTKLMLHSHPISRRLAPTTSTIELLYRVVPDGSFTSLNTFDESPEPTDPTEGRFPSTTSGKIFELKAILTGATTSTRPILDALTTRVLRRYPFDSLSPRVNIITCTVLAETRGTTLMGARTLKSALGLRTQLEAAQGAVALPVLTRPHDGQTWVVDLINMKGRWGIPGRGEGEALLYDLTFYEVPTILSDVAEIPSQHIHTSDDFVGDGVDTTFTLSYEPSGPIFVFTDGDFNQSTVDYNLSGSVITFTSAPANLASIFVEYPYEP